MKTITIDFETYEKELKEARLSGIDAKYIREELQLILINFNTTISYEHFNIKIKRLYDLLEKLK